MDTTKQNLAIATALGYWRDPSTGMWERENRALPRLEFRLTEWTTETHAAVGLCDVLFQDGFWCSIENTTSGWRCSFKRTGGPEYYHTAPTLAEAICGAFLKAKGLWEEE